MSIDPQHDPQFIGRIDFPAYQCYVICKKTGIGPMAVMSQSLHRLDNDEAVHTQSMAFEVNRNTPNKLIRIGLHRIDDALAMKWDLEQKLLFLTEEYRHYSQERKTEAEDGGKETE